VRLRPGDQPLVLVSAGIGITPAAAMIDHLARTRSRRVIVAAHADRSPGTHAFAAEIAAHGARIDSFTQLTWYEQPDPAGSPLPAARVGYLDPAQLPLPEDAWVHVCGPVPFLRAVRHGLLARGVPDERIDYEVFGPDLWAHAPGPVINVAVPG
jgi:nitric oxide dioxygenase